MGKIGNVHFSKAGKEFHIELRKRVDSYFSEKNIPKTGNLNMYMKTVILFSAYFAPFLLLAFGVFDQKSIWLLLMVVMGVAMVGIGMCVMHDANHGSYSDNATFDRLLGYVPMILLSGSSLNWRIQHNLLHHTYTNVHGYDEDIAPGFFKV